MTPAPRPRPALIITLILSVLAAPSALVAGAVQIALALDATECTTPAPCYGGGR
jgi:hypothetical protein